MDKCSYFIDNKAMFGGYPEQSFVESLEKDNVILFINLTCPSDKLVPYSVSDKSELINFPIIDRSFPKDPQKYSKFIINVCNKLKSFKKDEKLYLHCKGGHGRAGIVVASILIYLFNLTPERGLCLTREYHNNRVNMRSKWRQIGSPQTKPQKLFVLNFFKPLYYFKSNLNNITNGFSTFSTHTVHIEGKGTFQNAEAAFQSFKNEEDKDFLNKLLMCSDPYTAKKIGKSCKLRSDWFDIRDQIMYNIMKLKIDQHQCLKNDLLNTKLRYIIEKNKKEMYSQNFNNSGINKSGKILNRIREELLVM
jgi:predicted NAD-dependent protein-ADP-ribosyltransferase YbiA (DUF1768 family)